MSLLSIRNLHASIGDKEILKGVNIIYFQTSKSTNSQSYLKRLKPHISSPAYVIFWRNTVAKIILISIQKE